MTNDDGPAIKVRRRKLADYIPDPNNANKGSERGKRILATSLKERGAARSVVAAADDVLLAGNQTADAAAAAGITDVIEIESDGSALIVVKRTDLASGDSAARLLSYEDNRARDPAAWDAEQIFADLDSGLDLSDLFRMDELDDLHLDLDIDTQIDGLVDAALDADGESGSRIKGRDPARQIKPVLYADQVAVFEQALRATGIVNRGDALIAVCRHYLESRPRADAPGVLS